MATAQPVLKPEGKKLRRKLQKIGNQFRSCQITDCTDAKASKAIKSALKGTKYDADKTVPRTQPKPPDLSDTKWLEYVRKSGCLSDGIDPSPPPSKRETLSRPLAVIPELAHLRGNDEQPRISIDTTSSDSSSSTVIPLSPSLALARRYAKTPVFSIGQLEQLSRRTPGRARKVSSVELIAESYRKLLESRCWLLRDSLSDSPSSMYDDHYETAVNCPRSSNVRTPAPVVGNPTIPAGALAVGSPTSDDGTLVGFEEDTIYFKPISFTTEPSLTLQHYASRETSTTRSTEPPLDNPSLQICFDLLARELSSAVSGSTLGLSTETSALQIWVMIEAYEKLRDKVLGMRLEDDQAQPMIAMFDMWLQALYAVHDGFAGNDGQRSTSHYGELVTEALD